jgi:hypothetical protein
MNQSVETRTRPPAEEITRITAEYRRGGFARQAPAVVVYHDPHVLCPWPGCHERIAGIVFQLDRMGDAATRNRLLAAWWQGPGLVGKCPRCGRRVLFGLEEKRIVIDPVQYETACLPDDWCKKAQIVPKSQT